MALSKQNQKNVKVTLYVGTSAVITTPVVMYLKKKFDLDDNMISLITGGIMAVINMAIVFIKNKVGVQVEFADKQKIESTEEEDQISINPEEAEKEGNDEEGDEEDGDMLEDLSEEEIAERERVASDDSKMLDEDEINPTKSNFKITSINKYN